MSLRKLSELFPDVIIGKGLFSEMENTPWTNDISGDELDIMFFGNYGDKPIAPIFKLIPTDALGVLTDDGRKKVADLLIKRFSVPWKRRYEVLKLDYDPLASFKMESNSTTSTDGNYNDTNNISRNFDKTTTDKKTGTETTDNTITYDTSKVTDDTLSSDSTLTKNGTVAKTGTDTGTATTTYDTSEKNTGTVTVDSNSSKENNGTGESTDNIFGFNSSSAVPSNSQSSTNGSTQSGTSHNQTTNDLTIAKTGTDKVDSSIKYDTTDTMNSTDTNEVNDVRKVDETKTGTESTDNTLTYDTTNTVTDDTTETVNSNKSGTHQSNTTLESSRVGALGVFTNQDVLQKELDLWKYDYFKTVFDDIANILTLAIYEVDI